MTPPKGTDLIEARVLREQEWALECWHARLSWGQIRARAILPPEEGGLGYAISLSAAKSLVTAARAANGDLTMGREERVERQSAEIDARARAARYDLERAHAALAEPRPEPEEFYEPAEYALAVKLYAARMEAAAKIVESADRRLAAAMKDERDLHGLNAPTRIEADVTTHDGEIDALNAALAALGRQPIEVDA